jgi:hypothetical protein
VDKRLVEQVAAVVFLSLAVIFLGLTGYILANDASAAAAARGGVAFLAASLCAFLGNISRIESFKASPTGVEARMREVADVVDEAKATLKSLHEVAAMAGATLIDLNAASGRWGGGTTNIKKDALKARVLKTLRGLKLDDEMVARVRMADSEWVAIDYILAMFPCWPNDFRLTPEEEASWLEFSKPWRASGAESWPSPDECEAFMQKLSFQDLNAQELLADYRYYMTHNGEHRRPEIWRDRDSWHRRPRGPSHMPL